jgi:DNA invertase Pin-like site-specific DNA recombinase
VGSGAKGVAEVVAERARSAVRVGGRDDDAAFEPVHPIQVVGQSMERQRPELQKCVEDIELAAVGRKGQRS